MAAPIKYGLEQARIRFPEIVANANAGEYCIITKHGKPFAAVVPLENLPKEPKSAVSLLSLKGSGRGLWGPNPSQFIDGLRHEWD